MIIIWVVITVLAVFCNLPLPEGWFIMGGLVYIGDMISDLDGGKHEHE